MAKSAENREEARKQLNKWRRAYSHGWGRGLNYKHLWLEEEMSFGRTFKGGPNFYRCQCPYCVHPHGSRRDRQMLASAEEQLKAQRLSLESEVGE